MKKTKPAAAVTPWIKGEPSIGPSSAAERRAMITSFRRALGELLDNEPSGESLAEALTDVDADVAYVAKILDHAAGELRRGGRAE